MVQDLLRVLRLGWVALKCPFHYGCRDCSFKSQIEKKKSWCVIWCRRLSAGHIYAPSPSSSTFPFFHFPPLVLFLSFIFIFPHLSLFYHFRLTSLLSIWLYLFPHSFFFVSLNVILQQWVPERQDSLSIFTCVSHTDGRWTTNDADLAIYRPMCAAS